MAVFNTRDTGATLADGAEHTVKHVSVTLGKELADMTPRVGGLQLIDLTWLEK